MAQLVECCLTNGKIMGLILGQGRRLGCRFCPQSGRIQEVMFLSFCFFHSSSLPLSLESIKKKKINKKKKILRKEIFLKSYMADNIFILSLHLSVIRLCRVLGWEFFITILKALLHYVLSSYRSWHGET